MQGLKEHKYMDLLTILGYLIGIVIIIIGLITGNWPMYLLGAVIIILILRLIGYSFDRMTEAKNKSN